MRDTERLGQEVTSADLLWEVQHSWYITVADYFGDKHHTPEQHTNAVDLLMRVNSMVAAYVADGGVMTLDPDTGMYISGAKGGNGDGGFRTPASTTGVILSAHREGNGVDVSDQNNDFDKWITHAKLVMYGLWREAAPFTDTWAHLQRVPPNSGNRSFIPYATVPTTKG